jgi:hypothetical protein
MSLDRINFQVSNDTRRSHDNDTLAHGEWWAWTHVISRAIWQASTRVGLAIMTAGFALAASMLFQSPAGALYGPIMAWISMGLAIWFILSVAISTLRGS